MHLVAKKDEIDGEASKNEAGGSDFRPFFVLFAKNEISNVSVKF